MWPVRTYLIVATALPTCFGFVFAISLGETPPFFFVPLRCLLSAPSKVSQMFFFAWNMPLPPPCKSHTHSFISQLKCHLFKKRLFGVTNQNCSFSWLLSSIKYCLFPYHKCDPWSEMNGQIERDQSTWWQILLLLFQTTCQTWEIVHRLGFLRVSQLGRTAQNSNSWMEAHGNRKQR